ncbi:MAG: response regulator [Candidatus Cloacimonetes bacterium]|nr:response regulator [Candidatus Cloacimonadota bacterium]
MVQGSLSFERLPIDVLLVEDEKLMRDSIAEIMKRRVNNVYIADNGKEGLELFHLHRPQIILTDIRMPVMSGLDMLKEIRRIDDSTKVIVISAHSETDYLQKAINLGVDGFLMKPVNIDSVINQVSKVTRQIVLQMKAQEYENKLKNLNELIFQNRSRAAHMQSSMAPSWLMPEKKILFSSNYVVDESTPSGDFFDIIPISETRYITYLGHLPQHDIKSTMIMLTIKMTLDTIIKNELENASPGIILDRLKKILGSQILINEMELLVCLVDSDFEFVRYAAIGPVNILQFDKSTRDFCPLLRNESSLTEEDFEQLPSLFEETEFAFNDNKLNFIFSRNLEKYEAPHNSPLGLSGIKSVLNSLDYTDDFLIPYLFPCALNEQNYKFHTNDFTFLMFRKNSLNKINKKNLLVTFKSVLTKTSLIRKECEQFVLENTGMEELSFQVELVIAELLTNIIVHGLNNKPDTMVVLSLDIIDQVTISVWDKGVAWELPKLDKNDPFDLVDIDATSGRGMPIIVTLSDRQERKRIDMINQTKIFFNINPEKESL